MLYSSVEEYDLLDNRLIFVSEPEKENGPAQMQMQTQTQKLATAQRERQSELGEPTMLLQDADLDPVLSLYYPMATAGPAVETPGNSNSSVLSFSTTSSGPLFSQTSLYDMDFYAAGFAGRSASVDTDAGFGVLARDPLMSYTAGELSTSLDRGQSDSPLLSAGDVMDVGSLAGTATGTVVHVPEHVRATAQGIIDAGDTDADVDVHGDGDGDGEYDASEDISDSEPHPKVPRQRRFSSRTSSSSTLASAYGSSSKKVSDSRLSAQGLAEVLNLDSAEEALRRERFILDIFERELHYPLGYKTWVRDTSKEYRTQLLDQLHSRVVKTYPEYDKPVLETIIRRATYYMMQSRLRRERRAKAKLKRDQDKKNDSKRRSTTSRNSKLGLTRYGGSSGTTFMM